MQLNNTSMEHSPVSGSNGVYMAIASFVLWILGGLFSSQTLQIITFLFSITASAFAIRHYLKTDRKK